MLNICESCGQHSSQTVYELATQFELCPRCHYDLMKQLANHHQREHYDPERTPGQHDAITLYSAFSSRKFELANVNPKMD